VLLNGHPLNDVVRGYGPLGMDLGIDMAQVERIEVVRGEGMVFGTTAFLGLVNVVTRRPDEGVHVRISMAANAKPGLDAQMMASGRSGPGELVVLGGVGRSIGDPLSRPGEVGLLSDTESSRRAFVFGRYGGLSLTSGVIRRVKQVPIGFRWTQGQPVEATDLRLFAALQYDHTFPGGSFLLSRVAFDDTSYSLRGPRTPDSELRREETGHGVGISGEARFEWARSSTSRIILGAALRRAVRMEGQARPDDGTDGESYSGKRTDLTVYGSYEWAPLPSFLLHFGTRLNPFQGADTGGQGAFNVAANMAPVLAVVSKPYEGGSLKFTSGLTLRRPSERELRYGFESFNRIAPGRLPLERNFNVAVEHTHTLSEETYLTAAAFINAYDKIARTSPDDFPYVYSSSGPHTLGGTELELRYAPVTGQLVSVSGYLQSRFDPPGKEVPDEQGGGTTERRVVNSAEYAISARFGLPVLKRGLIAGVELVFTGARVDYSGGRVPESLYLNTMLSGELTQPQARWRLRYYGGVYNMLDERHPSPVSTDYERPTVPQYGREVRLGMSVSF
jgi:outer membrane receptor for ferrienterochelin and colicins